MVESHPLHPLDKADPDRCYDVMMSERTALITAKRETEDELVRTIIKLSSTALLIVPGALLTTDHSLDSILNWPFKIGAVALAISLIVAMLEQYLSSSAYDRQLNISMRFYQRKSEQTHDPTFSLWVRVCQTSALAIFICGILSSAIGLASLSGGPYMAQEPRPSPQPSGPPPGHVHDSPGRSVPPPAPPPPPPRRD